MRGLSTRRAIKAGLEPGTPVHIGSVALEPTRVAAMVYDETQVRESEIADLGACRALLDAGEVCWINLDGLHEVRLLQRLAQDFGLHPLVIEDIANTEQRPKLEDYGQYLYLVVKMLSMNGAGFTIEQVSLVLGPGYVLSFQEQGKPGDVFDPIRTRLRSGAGRIRGRGADFLAYSLIDAVVDQYFVILERLGERIEALEDQLLHEPSPATLGEIHALRREVIFLRRSVWPLREVLSGLRRGDSALVQPGTGLYLQDLYDHTIQVIDTVETLRDILQGMLDTYLSSVSYRMNEVMKVLTIIATVFIPLTFIVGVYGMNFDYFPELHWSFAYPVLWGLMITIAIFMIAFFRRRKWF
jgi:magnesium transporter